MHDRCVHDEIVTALALDQGKDIKLDTLEFKDYVSMGRDLLNKVECYQARIAFYALQVCTIRHGGHSDGFYTLKDYAKALNMNPKTLSGWTLAYRNVIEKLGMPLESIDKKVWKAVNRTNDNIAWAHRSDNRDGGKKKMARYKAQIPDEKVKAFFQKEYEAVDEPSFASELRGWMHSCRQMKNNLAKRDLSLAHEGDLIELSRMLSDSNVIINKFLMTKKK